MCASFERHAANTTEAAQNARAFVAVHRAEFGDAHGQVAIAVLL